MNSDINASRFAEISLRKAAIVAGLGLLIMAILAPIANFGVLQKLIVPGDATITASNIMASARLFRIGILCFLIVAILDVIVAWGLYVLLKPVNTSLSLLAAWFRVVYAAIFAVALGNLFTVVQILSEDAYLKAFETNQVYAQVMLSLDAFKNAWDLGLVLFGIHLLVLGYLAFQSGYVPRFLGILVVIAGLGYLTDGFGKFLSPNYSVTISMFTFIGEALLTFWLLWRGYKGFDKELTSKESLIFGYSN
ncbi:MAG TPA: DUF4386 domain-containing protein [Anaerolineales bacterium]|nr:DUF4386 domain-containing protein [Anaerolineales bacterium]